MLDVNTTNSFVFDLQRFDDVIDLHSRVTYNSDPTKVTRLHRFNNQLYQADLQSIDESPICKLKIGNNKVHLSNDQYTILQTQVLDFSEEEDPNQAMVDYVNTIGQETLTFEGDDLQHITYVYGSGKQYYSIGRVVHHYNNSTIHWVGGSLFDTNNRVSISVVGVGYGENKYIPMISVSFSPPDGEEELEEGVFTLVGQEQNELIEEGARYFLVQFHVMNPSSMTVTEVDDASLVNTVMGERIYTYKLTNDSDQFYFDEYPTIAEIINGAIDVNLLHECEYSKILYAYMPYLDINLRETVNTEFRPNSIWLVLIMRRIYYFNTSGREDVSKDYNDSQHAYFFMEIGE